MIYLVSKIQYPKSKCPVVRGNCKISANDVKTIEFKNGTLVSSFIWKDETVFLHKLVEGEVELLRLFKKDKQPFFLFLDNFLIELKKKDYLGQISYYTKDCEGLVDIRNKSLQKDIPYHPRDFSVIIYRYNLCKRFPSKLLYQESEKIIFGFFLGGQHNNFSFANSQLTNAEIKGRVSPTTGATVSATLTTNSKSEIHPFRISMPELFYKLDFKNTRLYAGFAVERKFDIPSQKRPFLEIGGFIGNNIINKVNFEFSDGFPESIKEQYCNYLGSLII